MKKVKVRIYNKSNNPNPEYATPFSAGADIRAYFTPETEIKTSAGFMSKEGTVCIHPGGRALIPTGLFVDIPDGYEIQVRPKSGKALKAGLTVLNTPGTIDKDYLYEIGVIVYNATQDMMEIHSGDAIAQLVIKEVPQIEWEPMSEETLLNLRQEQEKDSEARRGGFGSTEKK